MFALRFKKDKNVVVEFIIGYTNTTKEEFFRKPVNPQKQEDSCKSHETNFTYTILPIFESPPSLHIHKNVYTMQTWRIASPLYPFTTPPPTLPLYLSE